ncbi:MAG: acetylxylan esterase [Opitutaceae bacterium]
MMDLPPAIVTEADVPSYSLPSLLSREAMIGQLESTIYGVLSETAVTLKTTIIDAGLLAGSPGVVREQWNVDVSNGATTVSFGLAVFLPSESDQPVPLFLGLNFKGNGSVHSDPALILPPDAQRGVRVRRWPVEMIVERGYGLATIFYYDLAPDEPDQWRDGLARLWPTDQGVDPPGAVAAWAWGLSLARQVLAADARIDPDRLAVIGHSRLGKAALWAGACDPGFALVVSNDSGCGGAALSRRRFGERLLHINTRFPHWFTPVFATYNEREAELPVDQHQLLAAIAPRPLYVASAEEDLWADPRGEYLALKAAGPAWGRELPDEPPPVAGSLVAGPLGYHCRPGPHDLTQEDWNHYLDFADTVMAAPGNIPRD